MAAERMKGAEAELERQFRKEGLVQIEEAETTGKNL